MDVKLNLILHQNQEVIHHSPAKFIVVKSGKRFGKTELALYKLIKWAMEKPGGTFWYLTDTARHAEEIGWKRLNSLMPDNLKRSVNNNKLLIETVVGSSIKMMSADNPDYLRGVKLDGIVWEEAAYIKNGNDIWEGIINGQLSGLRGQEGGKALFISSPNKSGANWYSNFYLEALRKKMSGNTEWDAFHFTAWDNPLYDKATIQGWQDNCTEDTWQVEYMANESAHAGTIYSEFKYEQHVMECQVKEDAFLIRGHDWGIDHPTSCVWVYADMLDKKIYIEDEYMQSGYSIEESCDVIKKKTRVSTHADICDPSLAKRESNKRTLKDEYARNGIACMSGDNGRRGYDITKMFFKKDMIRINPKCKGLIQQLKNLQWTDKVDDDLTDPLRYVCVYIHDILFNWKDSAEEQKKEVVYTEEYLDKRRECNLNNKYMFPDEPKRESMSWLQEEVEAG